MIQIILVSAGNGFEMNYNLINEDFSNFSNQWLWNKLCYLAVEGLTLFKIESIVI